MQNGQFELAVAHQRDGRSVKIREYGRQGLTLVEGRRGNPYSIIFRNNSPNRVMAIISVDGLDVVDGKPATAESRGYVVEGYASAEIKGWRTSTSEVRQFFFEDKSGSYSSATQASDANCGIIACKVFAEKPKPMPIRQVIEEHHHHHHNYPHWPYTRPWWVEPTWCGGSTLTHDSGTTTKYTCNIESLGATGSPGPSGSPGDVQAFFMSNAASHEGPMMSKCASNLVSPGVSTRECDQSSQAPDFNLGTGWGAAMTDWVSMTSFEKAYEMASMSLYYTNADALQRMGIVLDKEVTVPTLPQGFGGFCQPPKGIR